MCGRDYSDPVAASRGICSSVTADPSCSLPSRSDTDEALGDISGAIHTDFTTNSSVRSIGMRTLFPHSVHEPS